MRLVLFNGKHKLDIEDECLYFDYTDLASIGVEKIVKQIKEFDPDLLIEEEKNDGMSLYTDIYKQLDVPKAYWLIDGHCNLIQHIVYAKQFQFVFCAQSWFVPIVQREVLFKTFWLPLCHTQTVTEYKELLSKPTKRDIPFSFIGNIRSIHVERGKYINQLLKTYPDKFFARQTDYDTTLSYLRRSQATFNCSLNNDLNFRVWEGLACGAAVVTDAVTDIYMIQGLEERVILYDKLLPNWSDLLLPSNDKGNEEFILASHTMTHRITQMLYMIEFNTQYEY